MLFASVYLSLIHSGCASLGKDECLNADWFGIGYEDGAMGHKASHIADHRRACAKYGVTPDFGAYDKGRRQGLTEYCTPRNGYLSGANGSSYSGVCPKELESAYLQAFDQGKAVYAYAQSIRRQDQALKKMYAELDSMDKDIRDKEAVMISDQVSPRRRKALLDEIRMREEDRRVLLDKIEGAEHAIADMRDYLEQMQTHHPYQ